MSGEDKTEWVAVVPAHVDLEKDDEEVLKKEAIEIQTEPDGKILLDSVTAQFPGTTGLKFRNPESGTLRGVRLHENQLIPPNKDGWGNVKYICVNPQAEKRKASSSAAEGSDSKSAKVEDPDAVTDLIVLGLPFRTKEDEIKKYFEELGEVTMLDLKRKPNGDSRGYAFIRFGDRKTQDKVMLTRHMIDDRWCDVRLPESQMKEREKKSHDAEICKVFVARVSEAITSDDLREHFQTFGEITDVFYPDKPFRGFAFVTFVDSKVAQSLVGKEHTIKGVNVHIGMANPKSRDQREGRLDKYRRDDYDDRRSSGGSRGGYDYSAHSRGYDSSGGNNRFGNSGGIPSPWGRDAY